MSATPIPRSLCLALMGDLDHTVIPDCPLGREPVATRVGGGDAAFHAVREAVERGERAFVVFPAIDADEIPALSREGAALVGRRGPLGGISHSFLHGRLPPEERDAWNAITSGKGQDHKKIGFEIMDYGVIKRRLIGDETEDDEPSDDGASSGPPDQGSRVRAKFQVALKCRNLKNQVVAMT